MQNAQQQTGAIALLNASYPPTDRRRVVLTVSQFNQRNPAWSELALRNLIFKAGTRHSTRGEIPGNGLIEAGAIVRIGRKVLIDEDAFFTWIDAQKGGAK